MDGANVVGSRPDGWWPDRAGAARRLYERLAAATLPYDRVVLVLEGAAKSGVATDVGGTLQVVHAPRVGDDEIVAQAEAAAANGEAVTVVTADRGLESRVRGVGAQVQAPGRFLAALPTTI